MASTPFNGPFEKKCIRCQETFVGISKICPACVGRKTTQLTHDELLEKEVERLTAEGYKCIPIGLKTFPKPDIIAIKDNKVIAEEIDLWSSSRSWEKYSNIHCYDDIQLIKADRPKESKK